MKHIFTLQRNAAKPAVNLRWQALLDLIELSDDELDLAAELQRGESFVTKDHYLIRRQDS